MSTNIYYFSGTGNSLYVAEQLSQTIPKSRLIPIPALLNKEKNEKKEFEEKNDFFKPNAEIIGLIFPCHGITIPAKVREFIKMLDISNSEYLFAVVTRGGSIFRGFIDFNNIIKMYGKKLDASFVIDMWMNDPKLKAFSVPTNEELKQIEENVQTKLDIIYEKISSQKEYHDDISGVSFTHYKWINSILERLIPFFMNHFATGVKKYFYTDSKCTGCGICEKMCLSNKIKLIDDKPVWQMEIECYLCYGCLNFCPNEAIQIYDKRWMKSYTQEKGRYPHPYATVKDMVNQKNLLE